MRQVFEDISDAYANVGALRGWAYASICIKLQKAVKDQNIKNPFTLDHLQWDKRAEGDNSAISIVEGSEKLDMAHGKIASTLQKKMPSDVRRRVEEIQWHLRYGNLSYQFYAYMSKVLILDRSGHTERAIAEFEKAKKIADELKKNEFSELGVRDTTNWFDKTQLKKIFNLYADKFADNQDESGKN
jgi:hypothetical protein